MSIEQQPIVLPGLQPLTEEEKASIQAYVARVEAEDARARAAGIPVFGDILDQIRDDDSDFSSALGEGYLAFWDLRGKRPDMTAQALFKYLTEEPDYSLEWNIGFACGWFAALGENARQASFFFNHDEQAQKQPEG